MSARIITARLTERQFSALAEAIAVRDAEDEGIEDLSPAMRGQARARNNAWNAIRRAWYSAERHAGSVP